ncbi:MlaD family protein [Aliarcobacter lanthieri]|uniref:MlaD family protein n=1 Tax=Aliarcobacter lanthieri TaxID=1355374 RepID=UPI00047C8D04|nr:MlaD family protein [Aliarcobacter lanthieri]QKF58300.1 lipid asymmetry ABC transporter MlaABCDEF, periplasmic component MlaD [Aliarcobacter lanthieri]
MDTRINFFRIGLFVSIVSSLLIIAIFWLGKYGLEDKKYDEYIIHFNESISGLNIGSSIKYMGFDVGVVRDIKINPQNSEQIKVELQIQKGTPIKEDNYGILGNLGITGLKYIELKGGSNDAKLLKENQNGEKVINSKKSALNSLVDSTEDITKEITLLLHSIRKVLNEENLKNLSLLLENSQKSMANVEAFSSYVIENQNNINKLLDSVKGFVNIGSSSFKSVKTSADNFKDLTTKMKEEFDKGTFDIKGLTQDSLDNLEVVLRNLDHTLNQTQDLVKNINESPSDLLFKQKNIKYGPGEKDEE